MAGAFQANAFQNNAFQVAAAVVATAVVSTGGGVGTGNKKKRLRPYSDFAREVEQMQLAREAQKQADAARLEESINAAIAKVFGDPLPVKALAPQPEPLPAPALPLPPPPPINTEAVRQALADLDQRRLQHQAKLQDEDDIEALLLLD